jgi:serine/threonine protein kinase
MAYCYREIFIQRNHNTFLEDYTLVKKLGAGAFATVYLAKHIKTSEIRAVKVVDKSIASIASIKNAYAEFEILKKLDHPNIIKVHGMYEDIGNIYIISE